MKRGTRFYRDGVELSEHEAFENGILRDGVVLRVPVMLRDSIRRTNKPRTVCVRDAFGNPAGHRPGYVTSIASDQVASRTKQMRDQAYSDYENRVSNQWRNQDSDENGFGSGEFVGAREGDACTVRADTFPLAQGAPGHIRNGICVPDSINSGTEDRRSVRDGVSIRDALNDHRQQMDAIYRDHDKRLSNQWRRG